ncbi:MAG: arginine efflux transporter ArgO [Nevskia sp.]|nr:arginine efflux transporter ArgO [Nevskia sp.]
MLTPELQALANGFGLSASLIVAIGAQNAFMLRQGLKREHVFTLATICFVSDATLIALGCAGFGSLVQAHPSWVHAVTWIGSAFLIFYGARSALAALQPRPRVLEAAPKNGGTYRKAVLTCLAMTWLNPHVYLDTVLLLGGIGGRYPAEPRVYFALGAMSVSCLWFYGLGYGAGWLTPLFHKPLTWRVLDAVIALTMWLIAGLLLSA